MKQKTKLLIVTDFFYPHWTGLSKLMYYLIQAIDKEIACIVLTVRIDKQLKKEEILLHTTVIREDPLFSFSRAKYSLKILWRFFLLVRQQNVVLINLPCIHVLPLAIMAKLFGKKVLIFYQGDLVLPKGVMNRFIEKVFDINTYLALALADKVTTHTTDYAKHSRILKSFLNKCTPLLFPIPSHPKISPLSTSWERVRGVRFGFAGRFVEEKGFDILFQAIPVIIERLPHAHFLYAGETHMGYENFFEENKHVYELVKQHVQFLGLLDEKKMSQFYRNVDFMIVPSRSDCFNLVQTEAMLAGTPCISSDIPGLRFLVQQTGFGMLFRKEDPSDLADKVAQAVAKKKQIMVSYTNVVKILDNKTNGAKIRNFITE